MGAKLEKGKQGYFQFLGEYAALIRQNVPGKYELEYSNTYYMESIRRELESVIAQEPQGSRILDLGCGRGHFSAFLQLRGMEAHGVDVKMPTSLDDIFLFQDASTLNHYPRLWAAAEARYGCKLGYYEDSRTAYPDGFFDVVLFFASYEHIPLEDVMAVTREAYRLLKPGGRVYMFHCPSHWSWSENLTRLLHIPCHPKLYSKRELLENFNAAGFQVIRITRADFLLSFVGPLTPLWVRFHALHLFIDKVLSYTPLRLLFHFFSLKAIKPGTES